MHNERTELVFILDKSGSMSGLEKDTIGGFNSMLARHRGSENTATVTTVLFDNRITLLHDRIDLRAVEPIDENDYFVGGSTALMDAVGFAVEKIESAQKHTAEHMRASKVLVVITTDGMENASRNYTAARIKAMIERKREEGWEFIFMGANIDAVSEAENIGISAARAVNYMPDGDGTQLNFEVLGEVMHGFMCGEEIDEAWMEPIACDYAMRSGAGADGTDARFDEICAEEIF